ncbi:MAG: hypothetical protein ACYC61_21930 [Isosphaeraceae bacterium]
MRRLPPPPAIPTYISGASGRSAAAGSRHKIAAMGMDETGRKDMSGRPVGFYPSSRGIETTRTQISAMKEGTSAAPPRNAQTNPFFVDPIQKQQTGR